MVAQSRCPVSYVRGRAVRTTGLTPAGLWWVLAATSVCPPLRDADVYHRIAGTAPMLPHVRGFPALGVLSGGLTPPGTFAALRLSLSGGAYALTHDAGRPPGFRTTSLFRPCRGIRPRRGLQRSRLVERLLLPSGYVNAVGPRSMYVSRLNPIHPEGLRPGRRTRPRLGCTLANAPPGLVSPWVASPCGGGNFTRSKWPAFPGTRAIHLWVTHSNPELLLPYAGNRPGPNCSNQSTISGLSSNTA